MGDGISLERLSESSLGFHLLAFWVGCSGSFDVLGEGCPKEVGGGTRESLVSGWVLTGRPALTSPEALGSG